MARGTAIGEPVVSQANTKAFEDGYTRVFGDHEPKRGRWVWDEALGRLVSAEDYQPPVRALDAPILAGRFYENTFTLTADEKTSQPLKVDIGSRMKHRQFMKDHGLTTYDDYAGSFAKKQAERERNRSEQRMPSRTRREAIARKLYEIDKP